MDPITQISEICKRRSLTDFSIRFDLNLDKFQQKPKHNKTKMINFFILMTCDWSYKFKKKNHIIKAKKK